VPLHVHVSPSTFPCASAPPNRTGVSRSEPIWASEETRPSNGFRARKLQKRPYAQRRSRPFCSVTETRTSFGCSNACVTSDDCADQGVCYQGQCTAACVPAHDCPSGGFGNIGCAVGNGASATLPTLLLVVTVLSVARGLRAASD
jgi:hypothetical protein